MNLLAIDDYCAVIEILGGEEFQVESVRFGMESRLKLYSLIDTGKLTDSNKIISISYLRINSITFLNISKDKKYSGLFIPTNPEFDPEFDAILIRRFKLDYQAKFVFHNDDYIEITNLSMFIHLF